MASPASPQMRMLPAVNKSSIHAPPLHQQPPRLRADAGEDRLHQPTGSHYHSPHFGNSAAQNNMVVGDFMVCVDRLLASACFDPAAVGGGGGGAGAYAAPPPSVAAQGDDLKKKKKKGGEMIECRICQEEGEESEMEAPCACNGTLKFAHRKCIQRWCNKKGDITCEICNQVYAPNYSAPPTRVTPDMVAIDIRQGWGTRIDLHDHHFLAIAAAEQELLQAEYEDYASANSNGIACCRSVALILMLLLLLRHILMVTRDAGIVQDASAFFNVILQFAGFLLPCYVIVRSCYLLQCRRRRQLCF